MKVTIGPYKNDESSRREEIVIHEYDTWNMDHTLAMIILPMLKQLKASKHGAPNVDVKDVPNHLKPTKEEIAAYNKDGATDEQFFERWDWIMDEMIWAFEQILDDDNDKQFFSGESDIYWEELENGYSEMKRGPNDTFQIDREGMAKHNKRIGNGLKFFGKYYRSLWD